MANTTGSESLFPILSQPLHGLGRMAAESEHVDAGHDVEFRSLEVRSVLNRSVSKRLKWMAWSINPYRGCEFGCRYCYARYTHEFLAPASSDSQKDQPPPNTSAAVARYTHEFLAPAPAGSQTDQSPQNASVAGAPYANEFLGGQEHVDLRAPEAFERRIFVKHRAAWLLEQELRKLERAGRGDEEIALGTATDPWQPIERRTGLTRSLLEVMARRTGLRLGIVTKSTLIERDLDLLREIDARSTLVVHITITTPDAELARKLEPRAPRPDLRFRTVERLRAAGIRTGILNSPLLPGMTDGPREIDTMARRASEAGASFFAAMPLFLKPCSRPTWFEFVREHYPHLQAEYLERFREMDFASRPYRERLAALVRASCIRYGLAERMTDALLTRDAGEGKRPSASVSLDTPAQGRLFG